MNNHRHLSTIILAAGKGTRMQSDQAKVLHLLSGKPLLDYSLNLAKTIGSERIVVIVGHQAELVRRAFPAPDIAFAEQRPQLGTGHAVLQARDQFSDYTGMILILCGDVPCLRAATVQSLIDRHCAEQAVVTVMTTILDDPGSYGRVITGPEGDVLKIKIDSCVHREMEGTEITRKILRLDEMYLALEAIGAKSRQRTVLTWKRKLSL